MLFRRSCSVLGLCSVLLFANGFAVAPQKSAQRRSTSSSTSHPRHSSVKRAAKKKATAAQAKKIKRLESAYKSTEELRLLAQELLDSRTKSGFSSVERFANRHPENDAGALAYLDLGYAHYIQDDFQKAIADLKKARAHSWELSEYTDYFLAMAYAANAQDEDVIPVLDGFPEKYPKSIFRRDAAQLLANSLLKTGSPAHAAEVIQSADPQSRPDLLLLLGKAYLAQDQKDKAASVLQTIYFELPLSSQASEAGDILNQLSPAGLRASRDARRRRAELLLRGGRAAQASLELQSLIADSAGESIPSIKVEYAYSLYRLDRDTEARDLLSSINDAVGEVEARRLYLLGEVARSTNDDVEHAKLIDRLRTTSPTSGWFQDALLSAGNMYLLRNDYKRAAEYYRELSDRFTAGRYGAVAHWKAAWLTYRMGNPESAARQFEEQISAFPKSPEVANALYWRGRIAEDAGEKAVARAYYKKLSERFRNFYYGELARERLKELKHGEVANVAVLDKIPEQSVPTDVTGAGADLHNLRLQKARLLSNGALFDYAVKELKAARAEGEGNWTLAEIARLEQAAGRPHIALETLKRAVPGYFSMDISDLPRSVWEVLFPRPYWEELKTYSRRNGLDPYLVASLIRQESEFNPGAVSRANAYGLMQLLPSVGKQVAREVKLRRFSTQKLLDPTANIRLGTRYFKDMVDMHGEQVEYALAAYNAGSNRVADWQSNGPYKDVYEFVESIPFTETREYVQAIIRNASVYRRLYGQP